MPIAQACDDYVLGRAATGENTNRLLFISGYPSKEMLLQFGNVFDIDPAFFDTHLSFIGYDATTCEMHPSYYTLPSHQQTIFQISVPCIGGAPEDSRYNSLSEKRAAFMTKMEKYLSDLKLGKNWNVSDSIVREVEVHDSRRFSLHQNITILTKKSIRNNDWLGKTRFTII